MDLTRMTATDALHGLQDRSWSSVELLEAQLARIDAANDQVNAVVTMDVEGARTAAAAADRARVAGEDVGPLGGLCVTVKDTFETKGLVTTAGAPALRDHRPERDADAVAALRAAGAIVLGKTNVPPFAGDQQTYNQVYGLTRNPWNPSRTAGGSSGGAAVAVACGFSLAETGSDIGGSIRFPAHVNGIFGLKPSLGVVSLRGHIPGPPGTLAHPDLSVVGPLGRSVEDLQIMFDVLRSVNAFRGVPGAALPKSPGRADPTQLRVGLWADDAAAPVSAACRAAVEAVGVALERAGAAVDAAIRPPIGSAALDDVYRRLLSGAMAAGLPDKTWNRLLETAAAATDKQDSPAVDSAVLMTMSHRDWLAADERRHQAIAAWEEVFEQVDVLVTPVAATPAFPHNTEVAYHARMIDVDGSERPYGEIMFWAGLATMPGLPAVTIPTGLVDGLPVGVQLIGRRHGDLALLDVARTMVEVTGAHFEAPPIPA